MPLAQLTNFPDVNTTLSCVVIDKELIRCENLSMHFIPIERKLSPDEQLFWIYLGAYLILICVAGLMSGLTLGILSMDVTALKVLMMAGVEKHKKYARRILPLARRQHLVLIVLVLANSFAVEAMPIFLDRISDPIVAITVSTTAVVIFGEVLPQAVCSRFGLAIGYYLSWLVWVLIGLFFIVGYPLSRLLDFILGKDHGTFYRRAELQALVSIHGPAPVTVENGAVQTSNGDDVVQISRTASTKTDEYLTLDEVLIMKGALSLQTKQAQHAMTPLEKVFMLPLDSILNRETLQNILNAGHSRIPLYENDDRNQIAGVLLVKKLILIDPDDNKSLRQATDENFNGCFRKAVFVSEVKPLYELLNDFQVGYSHIAFVTKSDPDEEKQKVIGIVTLEQVLELLLQEEIYDENDTMKNVNPTLQIARIITVASQLSNISTKSNKTPSPAVITEEPVIFTVQTTEEKNGHLAPPS